MDALRAFEITEVKLQAVDEIFHALKILEHSSIVQQSMPQCEFYPPAATIESHLTNVVTRALGSPSSISQAKKLVVSIVQKCTSYDRPTLPQVRAFMLKLLIQTIQQPPAAEPPRDLSYERDRESLCKTLLNELLVGLDFRLLTLWHELLAYWKQLVPLVDYKTLRDLLPALFEQASKLPLHLQLATEPIKAAVQDYLDTMQYVISRQNALLPSLLVIDQMRRSFGATTILPPSIMPGVRSSNSFARPQFYLREAAPTFKHELQREVVDQYVRTFQPIESILKINGHVKALMLPVLGISSAKGWLVEPTTLRFANRLMWEELLPPTAANSPSHQQQQLDFVVRLMLMPNSRDSIMHFLTSASPDINPEKHSLSLKPESLQQMLEHSLDEVFVCAVVQAMMLSTPKHASAADAASKTRRTLLWQQLSQDLLHRYQLHLIKAPEVIVQLADVLKNRIEPTVRAASIEQVLNLIFDFLSCTQNVKGKAPRDEVFDLLRLFSALFEGDAENYPVPDDFNNNFDAVVKLAPASLWNYLHSITPPEMKPYVLAHRPAALQHHFQYLNSWRSGALSPKIRSQVKVEPDAVAATTASPTDIEYVIAANAFSNDEDAFATIGTHFLDQLLPPGQFPLTSKTTRKTAAGAASGTEPLQQPSGAAAAPPTPAIKHLTTFGIRLFEYNRPLSWAIIDLFSMHGKTKLISALRMSYMKFLSVFAQALNSAIAAANSNSPPAQPPTKPPPPRCTAELLLPNTVQMLLNNITWLSPACIETYAKFLFSGVSNEINLLFARAQKNIISMLQHHQQHNVALFHQLEAGYCVAFSPIMDLLCARNWINSSLLSESLRSLHVLVDFQAEKYPLYLVYNPTVALSAWRVIVQSLVHGLDVVDVEANILSNKLHHHHSHHQQQQQLSFEFLVDKSEDFIKLVIVLLAQASHVTGAENNRTSFVKQQLMRLIIGNNNNNNGSPPFSLPWHMVHCMPEHMQRTLTQELCMCQPMPLELQTAVADVERTAEYVRTTIAVVASDAADNSAILATRLADYFSQPTFVASKNSFVNPPSTLYAHVFTLLYAGINTYSTTNSQPDAENAWWNSILSSLGGLSGLAVLADSLRSRTRRVVTNSNNINNNNASNPSTTTTTTTPVTMHQDNVRTLAYYVISLISSSSSAAAPGEVSENILTTLELLIFQMGLFTLDTFLVALLLAPTNHVVDASAVVILQRVFRLAIRLLNSPQNIQYVYAAIVEHKLPSPCEWLPTVHHYHRQPAPIAKEDDNDEKQDGLCSKNIRFTEEYPELVYFSGQVRPRWTAGADFSTWCRSTTLIPTVAPAVTETITAPTVTSSTTAIGRQVIQYITPPHYFINAVGSLVPCVELLLHSMLALMSATDDDAITSAVDNSSAAKNAQTLNLLTELLKSSAMWIMHYHVKPLSFVSNMLRYFELTFAKHHHQQQQLGRNFCRAILMPLAFCKNKNVVLPSDILKQSLHEAFRRHILPSFTCHFAAFLLQDADDAAVAELRHEFHLADRSNSSGENVQTFTDQLAANLYNTLYTYYSSRSAAHVVDGEKDDSIIKIPTCHSSFYLGAQRDCCIDYRFADMASPAKRTLFCALIELSILQPPDNKRLVIESLLSLPERIELAFHQQHEKLKAFDATATLSEQFDDILKKPSKIAHAQPTVGAINHLKLANIKVLNCIAILLANMPKNYLELYFDQLADVIEKIDIKHDNSDNPVGCCTGVNKCSMFNAFKISMLYMLPIRKSSADGSTTQQPYLAFARDNDESRTAIALHLFRNVCLHLSISQLYSFVYMCTTNTTSNNHQQQQSDAAGSTQPPAAITITNTTGRWVAKVNSEAKLLFMLHCFGPILERFKHDWNHATHKVRYAALQLLAQVDRHLSQSQTNIEIPPLPLFKHAYTISDFFYILKYLYTGDARLFDSNKLSAELQCPAMRMQLKFFVAPEPTATTTAAGAVAATTTTTTNDNHAAEQQALLLPVDAAAVVGDAVPAASNSMDVVSEPIERQQSSPTPMT